MTRRCDECRHFSRPSLCLHYGVATHPRQECSPCPAFTQRAKERPPTRTKATLCALCRHYPGAPDQFCPEGNRHASARTCPSFALPLGVTRQ